VVRRSLPFLILALTCVSHADRVITVPRGGKIPVGTLRGEYFFEPQSPGSSLSFLGTGINSYFDIEFARHDLRNQESYTEVNLNFNLNAPLAGYAPGISFGILDAADQSPLGLRGYIAVSFQDNGGGPIGSNSNVETTLGVFVGRDSNAFIGVSMPLHERFRFLVEHDGIGVNAGAELRLQQGAFFKLLFLDSKTLVSAGATIRF
jgi:hypothetical protein